MPDTMKYFCISEATAFYLQKYVVYRKRKIFFGKHRPRPHGQHQAQQEKFLLPCSDLMKPSIPKLLDEASIDYTRAMMYRTVCSDFSDLSDVKYDCLVFYSPSGIESLFKNFPDFEQGETRIATFGPTTAKAAEQANLRIDISAPTPQAP